MAEWEVQEGDVNKTETLQAFGTVAKRQLSHGHTIHVTVTKPANSLAVTSHGNMSHIQQTTSIHIRAALRGGSSTLPPLCLPPSHSSIQSHVPTWSPTSFP
ncbi:unnamed protein product [Leuciscus chuanchicus]